MSGRHTSLEHWKERIRNQLDNLLNPIVHHEVDPGDALTESLDEEPSWTLVALADVAQNAESSAVRTLALVLIRQFIFRVPEGSALEKRAQVWDILSVKTQDQIRTGLLQCIEAERDDQADEERNNICKTASYIAEGDSTRGYGWPELEATLKGLLAPNAPLEKHDLFYKFVFEYPMLLLDTEVEEVVASMQFGLQERTHLPVVVQAMKASVAILQTDDRAKDMVSLMPSVLDVFPYLSAQDEQALLSRALYAFMEIYNGNDTAALLEPYLRQFLPFILSLLSDAYSADVQKAVLEILASTAEMDPDLVRSEYHTEMRECVQRLLIMMCHISGTATDSTFWDADVDDHSAEEDHLHIIAEDTLDRLLHSLGAQIVLPTAFGNIPSMLASDDWKQRYAALSAIGTLAEGSTAEFQKDLHPIIRLILPALSDSNARIQYAAVYATAELCTYLEGTVQSMYGETILHCLGQIISQRETPARLIGYACSALVNFLEEREDVPPSLQRHAQSLLERVLAVVDLYSMRDDARMRAMSAVSALASALGQAKQLSKQAYHAIMFTLWPFIDGQAEPDMKARALDCLSIVVASVDRELMESDAARLIPSLVYIQSNHTEDDDPCRAQVLVSFTRLAEALGRDFLPHSHLIIPILLRQASMQVEFPANSTRAKLEFGDVMEDDEEVVINPNTGELVRVRSEAVREKAKATELLASLAQSLGEGLNEVGNNENTAGDWTSYAESMLDLAGRLLSFEHDADVRMAAASMLPPLIRAIKVVLPSPDSYHPRLVEPAIRPLLDALAYEPDVEPLSVLYSATSEIVAAVPEAFKPVDAETFIGACLEQIEQMRKLQKDGNSQRAEDLAYYRENFQSALEHMSAALQAFIKISKDQFPLDALFETLEAASKGELGLTGEREWALRLLSDLIEHASPAAMAWSAGFLPTIAESLHDEKPIIRHISAYLVGMAATIETGLYTDFCHSCVPSLRRLLTLRPDFKEADQVLAYDNVVSALAKILPRDSAGNLPMNEILPEWLGGLPIRYDVEEMEPCYSLLLDMIAREHPAVSPESQLIANMVLNILFTALDDPKLPIHLREPLHVVLRSYLARTQPEVQQIWASRMGA